MAAEKLLVQLEMAAVSWVGYGRWRWEKEQWKREGGARGGIGGVVGFVELQMTMVVVCRGAARIFSKGT
jgi:hypothetical protein